jgi:hypothetical protein
MENLQNCIEALQRCANECMHCALACLRETKVSPLRDCIRMDLECESICRTLSLHLTSGSPIALQLCVLCADMCDACAAECETHTYMEHCAKCAEACRMCAKECRMVK